MTKQITLEINQRVGSLNKGDTVVLDVDSAGTPLDQFWRRRLKDSEIDNCVTVQKKRAATKPPKAEPEKTTEEPIKESGD